MFDVQKLASIQHPNCCKLIHAAYDPSGNNKALVLLFETFDQNLSQFIEKSEFNELQRFTIALEIIKGVKYLHSK